MVEIQCLLYYPGDFLKFYFEKKERKVMPKNVVAEITVHNGPAPRQGGN